MIRDVISDSGSGFSSIPETGIKKAPDPGSVTQELSDYVKYGET
jgi:hypothetical protein